MISLLLVKNISHAEENYIQKINLNNSYNNMTKHTTDTLDLKDQVVGYATVMSGPAPVKHPGQPNHEIVMALPIRDDGKIWSGTVTFTASKPIEVEILHTYDPKIIRDLEHGEPYHAVLPGNKSIAISQFKQFIDLPLDINGTAITSGSLEFVGSALIFHKTNAEPFTVTYSIDAEAKMSTFTNK
jgi:hypothetical protein